LVDIVGRLKNKAVLWEEHAGLDSSAGLPIKFSGIPFLYWVGRSWNVLLASLRNEDMDTNVVSGLSVPVTISAYS